MAVKSTQRPIPTVNNAANETQVIPRVDPKYPPNSPFWLSMSAEEMRQWIRDWNEYWRYQEMRDLKP